MINVKDKADDRGEKGAKELLVEGYGLQKVMTTEGTSARSRDVTAQLTTDTNLRHCG